MSITVVEATQDTAIQAPDYYNISPVTDSVSPPDPELKYISDPCQIQHNTSYIDFPNSDFSTQTIIQSNHTLVK